MLFNYLTNYHLTRSKGIVLTLVLYILVVFVIIGLVLVTLMLVNNQSSYQLLYSTQAYYLTEAGVEYGIYQLSSDPQWLVDNDALSFDGVDDYVRIIRNSSLEPTSQLTLEAWVKFNSIGDVWIVDKDAINTDYTRGYLLRADTPSNTVGFYVTGTNIWSSALSTNSWYHIAGIYNGSNMYLYVNGVLNAQTAKTGSITYGTRNLFFASQEGTSLFFNGLIDEVRIYNRALSEEEIKFSYNYKMPMNREGLVGWWKFASGYTSIDSSGKGNNGMVYGATSTTGVYKPSPIALATGKNFNPPGQSNCSFSVSFMATAVQNGLLTSVSSVPATQVISLDKTPAQRVVSVNVPRIY